VSEESFAEISLLEKVEEAKSQSACAVMILMEEEKCRRHADKEIDDAFSEILKKRIEKIADSGTERSRTITAILKKKTGDVTQLSAVVMTQTYDSNDGFWRRRRLAELLIVS
jgi:flagellar hook-basal body complex protein FliE